MRTVIHIFILSLLFWALPLSSFAQAPSSYTLDSLTFEFSDTAKVQEVFVEDGKGWIVVGNYHPGSPWRLSESVFAFDGDTISLVKSFENQQNRYLFAAQPAVLPNMIILESSEVGYKRRWRVFALNGKGEEVWEFKIPGVFQNVASISIAPNGTILVSSMKSEAYFLFLLSDSGKLIWEKEFASFLLNGGVFLNKITLGDEFIRVLRRVPYPNSGLWKGCIQEYGMKLTVLDYSGQMILDSALYYQPESPCNFEGHWMSSFPKFEELVLFTWETCRGEWQGEYCNWHTTENTPRTMKPRYPYLNVENPMEFKINEENRLAPFEPPNIPELSPTSSAISFYPGEELVVVNNDENVLEVIDVPGGKLKSIPIEIEKAMHLTCNHSGEVTFWGNVGNSLRIYWVSLDK